MNNSFGNSITTESVVEDFTFLDSWEDRYRYIIDLGKQLSEMDNALKTQSRLIPGCQSKVWLEPYYADNLLTFDVHSDSQIVNGLLAVVLSAYNKKTPEHISTFDIESFFLELDLIKHLSVTRGNGLRSVVKKIQSIALYRASETV